VTSLQSAPCLLSHLRSRPNLVGPAANDHVPLAQVAEHFEQRKDRGLTNQSLGNRSYGLDLSEIPADVRKLLLPYSTGVRSR